MQDVTGSKQLMKNQGFFIKYIMKAQPQTYGRYGVFFAFEHLSLLFMKGSPLCLLFFRYTFEVNNGADKDKFILCRLKILQIGSNYPCAKDVSNTEDKSASTKLHFDGSDTYTGEEKTMSYEFLV